MPQSVGSENRNPAVVNTTNAVATSIKTFAPSFDNCTFQYKATFIGKSAANEGVICSIEACCRVLAGTVSVRGAPVVTASIGDAALVACVPSLVAGGGTLDNQIAGIAATVIGWICFFEYKTGDHV